MWRINRREIGLGRSMRGSDTRNLDLVDRVVVHTQEMHEPDEDNSRVYV